MSRPALLALDAERQRILLAELSDLLQDMVFAAGAEVDHSGDAVLGAVARAFAALGVLEADETRMRLTLTRDEIARRIAEAPLEALPLPVDVLAVTLYVAPGRPVPGAPYPRMTFGAGVDAVLDALGLTAGPGGPPDATLHAMLIDLTLLSPPGGAWSEEEVVMLGDMARHLAATAPAGVPRAPGQDPEAIARLTEAIRTRSRLGHWLTEAELARPGAGRPWGALPQLLVRALRGLPL